MKAIEIKQVTKRFGNRKVIDGFSLSIDQGAFVAIVGQSGCGKSTLLNMMGLLETIEEGEIKIYGQPLPNIHSMAATRIRRKTINYLFQSYALISNLSVKENLMIALEYVKLNRYEKYKKIEHVLRRLGIEDLAQNTINTLSGGEQQRVAVARTILKPGDIILADEPTGSLDPQLAHTAFQLIQELRDQHGKTVVLVTHNMEQAQQADRVINLSALN
ncbi:ABC transporter ATP-binding protein [Staphylococcus lutrae]|uniref:ABC transporter n=1 Tax=Staphylococcus lutrae TaxID=155085 RepID=A0AAC9RT14_9STAP|nr:ATP-binding cassette domain-containing protein [Staphylococcus lutrae]ARJ51116.1 ABC transporter [Staphylococcus lutrae]PNZ34825.1 ABC transporter [Staphylococcus lutrae]